MYIRPGKRAFQASLFQYTAYLNKNKQQAVKIFRGQTFEKYSQVAGTEKWWHVSAYLCK